MTTHNPKTRWLAHVDLDAFFASVEQRDQPKLRGRPVVVGARPGNRGVVTAASYEARVFGIHSAMPMGEAVRRCPDAVFLPTDLPRYRQASRAVFAILAETVPVVEAASIDEAYLDISGMEKLVGEPHKIGALIRERIRSGTGLTASVGIGPNRLIAKLGSEDCKPDGLRVIPHDHVREFLDPLPVSKLRGLGKRTARVFTQLGIKTIGELHHYKSRELEQRLGSQLAAKFRRQAEGVGAEAVVPGRRRKSVSKETTFNTDVGDDDYLHDVLRTLAASVAATARQESFAGAVVTLKVRYAGFETHTRQQKLDAATVDERQMLRTAWRLYQSTGLPRRPVRLIGIGLAALKRDDEAQPDLFGAPAAPQRDQRVLNTIDAVRDRFGDGKLAVGLARQSKRR